MTDNDLAAIEARANAAIQGPWSVSNYDGIHVIGEHGVDDERYIAHLAVADGSGCNPPVSGYLPPRSRRMNTAIFIATARSDVPALIAEVRLLRNERSSKEAAQHEAARLRDRLIRTLRDISEGRQPDVIDIEKVLFSLPGPFVNAETVRLLRVARAYLDMLAIDPQIKQAFEVLFESIDGSR